MKEMHEKISHGECNEKSCRWPCNHKVLNNLTDTGEYMGVPICDQYPGFNLTVNRSFAVSNTSNANEDAKVKVSRQVTSMLKRLEDNLRKEVFSDSAKEMIEQRRLVTDLKMLAVWV